MAIITDIKNQIKAKLDALVTSGVLGSVIMDDFKTDPTSIDIPKYPCAILSTPACGSQPETNRENMRDYTFDIPIIEKGENVTGATQIEELIEAIQDAFDNDPTLGGKADGGIEPAISNPDSINTGDKSIIMFVVTLKAKASKFLSF
jgi:hypothetical protein